MTFELDKASRIAMDAQVKEPWHQKLRNLLETSPPFLKVLAYIFIIVAVGALVSATFWEANNAGGGFVMLGKGVTAPMVAYTAGAGFTIAYLVFHRFTAEAMREYQWSNSKVLKPGAAALVFGLLSLGGVFANLVDNAQANTSISKEQSADRAILLADVRAIRAQINSFDELQMQAMVDADRRAHSAMLAEAAGWGMADLDPDGACVADLRPRQRQLCNLVNGPDGVLSSIAQGEAALESHERAKITLAIAEQALAAAPRAESAEFWDGAAKLIPGDGQTGGERFLVLFMLAISVLTLFGTGLGWDAIFEYLEGRRGANKGVP